MDISPQPSTDVAQLELPFGTSPPRPSPTPQPDVPPGGGATSREGPAGGAGSGQITSDTSFQYPVTPDVGPVIVHPDGTVTGDMPSVGLQQHDIRHGSDPNKIRYHENMTFHGVTRVEATDAAGTTTSIPVPVRDIDNNPQNFIGPRRLEPWPLQARAHSLNPGVSDPLAHSSNNPTTQLNTTGGNTYSDASGNRQSTRSPDFGPAQLASPDPIVTSGKKSQLYANPETGTFVPTRAEGPTPGTTIPHPDIGPAHLPIGGRDRGPTGLGAVPGLPAGVPSPGAPAGAAAPATPAVAGGPDPTLWSVRPEPRGIVHTIWGHPGAERLPDYDLDADLAFFDQYSPQGPSTPSPGSGGGPSGPNRGPIGPPTPPIPSAPVGGASTTPDVPSAMPQPRQPSGTQRPASTPNEPLQSSASVTPLQSYNMATRATRMSQDENQPAQQQEAPGIAAQVGQMFLPQFFGPGGKAPTQEQREAAHRARFAPDAQDAPPGVERVNPNYPPPPGTPQQLEAIQLEIQNLLAARAQAERAETAMESQENVLQADQAPIQQALQGTDGGISAVQAHQEAVTRQQQVNQEQQQRQQETGTLVSGYPGRAAGLATLTIPLAAFEGFTRYASHLPGDAGAAMADMNTDAVRIQEAFAQMAVAMASQDEAQPTRQQELAADQGRIQTTDDQASTSQQDMEQSKQTAVALKQQNDAQRASAGQAREQASRHGQALDTATGLKQQQAATLAQQLQVWAQQHQAAHHQAVEATAEQLKAQGLTVVEKSEG